MNRAYAAGLKKAMILFVLKFSAIAIGLSLAIFFVDKAMSHYKDTKEEKKRHMLAVQTSMAEYQSLARNYKEIESQYNAIPDHRKLPSTLDRKIVMDTLVSTVKKYGFTSFTMDEITPTETSSISDIQSTGYTAHAFKISITFNHILEQPVFDFMDDMASQQGFIVLKSLSTSRLLSVNNQTLQELNIGTSKNFLRTSITFYWIYLES